MRPTTEGEPYPYICICMSPYVRCVLSTSRTTLTRIGERYDGFGS